MLSRLMWICSSWRIRGEAATSNIPWMSRVQSGVNASSSTSIRPPGSITATFSHSRSGDGDGMAEIIRPVTTATDVLGVLPACPALACLSRVRVSRSLVSLRHVCELAI